MQIIEMITRRDGSLHLAVRIGNTEYINPLADWVRLAEKIIEEAETHLTPVADKGWRCPDCDTINNEDFGFCGGCGATRHR
jgi:hypothetical protein